MRNALTATLVATFTGFWFNMAAAQGIEVVCKAAEAEPPLIWYTSQDPARSDELKAKFAAKYPNINLQVLRLATGSLGARYSAERAAGVVNASLVTLGDPNFINSGFTAGWFVELEKSELPEVSKLDDRWFKRGAAVTSINVLGISYNTDKAGDTPPKSWKDLASPKYKGSIIFGDPRAVPSYMALLRIWSEKFGDDFIKSIAAQKPVFVPSVVPATQQLAAGEIAIVAPNTMATSRPLMDAGAPVNFIIPDVTTGNEFITVLSKDAKSPQAAKCLYNFLFTPEGQQAYSGPESVSPIGAAGGGRDLPSGYIPPRIEELGPLQQKLSTLIGVQ